MREIQTSGIIIGDKRKIKIALFLFEIIKRDLQEITHFIANLYHEIRHAKQVDHNLYQDEEEISIIDGNLEADYRLPSEKDAYHFQDEQMRVHGVEVLKISEFKLPPTLFLDMNYYLK